MKSIPAGRMQFVLRLFCVGVFTLVFYCDSLSAATKPQVDPFAPSYYKEKGNNKSDHWRIALSGVFAQSHQAFENSYGIGLTADNFNFAPAVCRVGVSWYRSHAAIHNLRTDHVYTFSIDAALLVQPERAALTPYFGIGFSARSLYGRIPDSPNPCDTPSLPGPDMPRESDYDGLGTSFSATILTGLLIKIYKVTSLYTNLSYHALVSNPHIDYFSYSPITCEVFDEFERSYSPPRLILNIGVAFDFGEESK